MIWQTLTLPALANYNKMTSSFHNRGTYAWQRKGQVVSYGSGHFILAIEK